LIMIHRTKEQKNKKQGVVTMRKTKFWLLGFVLVFALTFVFAGCENGDDGNADNGDADNGVEENGDAENGEEDNDAEENGAEDNGAEAEGNDDEDILVEIIAKGFQHDFWQAVLAGAEQEAADLGVDINFVGPASEADIAEQVQMLAGAINREPAAIGFAALDTLASMDELERAMNNGIPIIGFDSGVPDAPEGSILADVATDNAVAGAMGAQNMYSGLEDIDAISGATEPVRIGIVSQEVDSLSIYLRTRGFVDEMNDLLSDNVGAENVAIIGHSRFENDVSEDDALVILEVRVPAEITDAAGTTEALTLLNRDDLIGIFGSNEFSANVIITADDGLTDGRIGNDVLAVGFDSGTLQNDAVRSERFYGSVTQDPVSMGAYTVRLAVAAARGETVEDVDTGAQWFNSENIDDPDIQQLLFD